MSGDPMADALRTARIFLENYYAEHAMGVNAVIQSQWARGVLDARGEVITILNDEIRRLTK